MIQIYLRGRASLYRKKNKDDVYKDALVSAMGLPMYYNGIKIGTYSAPIGRKKSLITRLKSAAFGGGIAPDVDFSSASLSICGYFAKSDESECYDLFVGYIKTRTTQHCARVYRVVWGDEINIINIHRDASSTDISAAKSGKVCSGVKSSEKNTDLFRIVGGVRITVII